MLTFLFASTSWGSNYPLEPPDTSSPQATLQYFLHFSANALRDNDFKSKMTKEHLGDAIHFLNLSNVAPTHAENVGIESVLLLREIFDRIQLPEISNVPDATAVKSNDLEQWRVPHTEITIAKVTDGNRAGAFLFTAETIDRLDEYYAKVQHLPYKNGALEGIYEKYMYSSGWLYPDALINKLPQWMMHVYKGQAVWKWIELVTTLLIGSIIIALIIRGYRYWNKMNTDKTWRFHMLISPLMAVCMCLIMVRLVNKHININR